MLLWFVSMGAKILVVIEYRKCDEDDVDEEHDDEKDDGDM